MRVFNSSRVKSNQKKKLEREGPDTDWKVKREALREGVREGEGRDNNGGHFGNLN